MTISNWNTGSHFLFVNFPGLGKSVSSVFPTKTSTLRYLTTTRVFRNDDEKIRISLIFITLP